MDNAAEALAPADTPSYTRLTDIDRCLILKLRDSGLTQVEIAQRLDRAQSTVADVLHAFTDTTEPAKRYLRGQALVMAENIVKKGLARDHVKTLEGLDVLAGQSAQGFTLILNGLTIHGIGRPETVEGEVLSPSTPQLESESR